jgi:putative transposase
MPLRAAMVTILPGQRDMLARLARTRPAPQQLALRARMILQVADGIGVCASARELGVWPKTVRYWCRRWRQTADGRPVVERLADAPRSGAPATFTAEQICAVMALTCERPQDSDRPISQRSQREIADEVMRRGIIERVSQRSIGRFLKKKPTFNRIESVIGWPPSLMRRSTPNAPTSAMSIRLRPEPTRHIAWCRSTR